MIIVLTCFCPNADIKAYRFLQNKVENWSDVPLYRGRVDCGKVITNLASHKEYEMRLAQLSKFISDSSRFIIILGWDEHKLDWSDISHGDMKAKADAEIIIERFA